MRDKIVYFVPQLCTVTVICMQFLGRLFDRVDLIKLVSNGRLKWPSVCLSVHTCVCRYVHPSTKSFSDFNEIWHVGRGR